MKQLWKLGDIEPIYQVYRIIHENDELDLGEFFIFEIDGEMRDSRCHNLHIQK